MGYLKHLFKEKKICHILKIVIVRAILIFLSGFCFEIGTSFFAGLTDSWLPIVIIVVVTLVFNMVVAGINRPIRKYDNDIAGALQVIFAAWMSFSDNFFAGLIPSESINLAVAILCLLLGGICMSINITYVDRQYENFINDKGATLCIEQIIPKKEGENIVYKYQNLYNIRMIKTIAIAAIGCLVVLAATVVWGTYGIYWGV